MSVVASAQPTRDSLYTRTYDRLKRMLEEPKPRSFKEAVFLTENAYLDGKLSQKRFNANIEIVVKLAQKIASQNSLIYSETDRDKVNLYAAAFRIMKDSVDFMIDSINGFKTIPYSYDFDDFWGDKDWTKMFVSKLLEKKAGNCHSLPFLYKIVCEDLGIPAWLAMAPNHTYIKLWTKKTGWFNTELTSGYFPIDAWIMASGYIHLNAVQNRIYMDTLSQQQSIAICLIDLAKGYEKKFGEQTNPDFVLQCANTALIYYPQYINGLLMKAETMKRKFEKTMKLMGAKYPAEAFSIPEAKNTFEEMEKLYFHIYQLGYRPMPRDMYMSWLTQLKEERSKYVNRNVINNLRSSQN